MGLLFQGGVEFPTGGKSAGRGARACGHEGLRAQPISPRTRQALVRLRAEPVEIRCQRLKAGWKRQVILVTEQSTHIHVQNTNRWSTKQLVTMALMCAVSAIFMFVQIPIIPAAPFLTYDPSLVPAMVSGFAYGPGSGIAVGVLAVVIHALTTGDWVGALMNTVAAVLFILPAALVYGRRRTFAGAVIGLALGVVLATVGAIASNLTIGVWFWYGSADVILPLMVPAVIPFNLVKTLLNSVLTIAVYKAISNLITPKKDQVKGRA